MMASGWRYTGVFFALSAVIHGNISVTTPVSVSRYHYG